MLNKVILIGRLTNDLEIRHSNDNLPYCYFTLAVNRTQSRDNKTDFISCVAFRSTAELMARYLKKGSLISVEGRLEVYRNETNGEFQTRTNVVVNTIDFLETKKSTLGNDNLSFANDSIKMNQNLSNNQDLSISSDSSETEEEFDFDNFEIKI